MQKDGKEAERRRDRTEGRPEHGGADPQNCPLARLSPPTSYHHFFSGKPGATAVQIQHSARPLLSPPPAARLPITYHRLSWRSGAKAGQTWTSAVSCRRARTEGEIRDAACCLGDPGDSAPLRVAGCLPGGARRQVKGRVGAMADWMLSCPAATLPSADHPLAATCLPLLPAGDCSLLSISLLLSREGLLDRPAVASFGGCRLVFLFFVPFSCQWRQVWAALVSLLLFLLSFSSLPLLWRRLKAA